MMSTSIKAVDINNGQAAPGFLNNTLPDFRSDYYSGFQTGTCPQMPVVPFPGRAYKFVHYNVSASSSKSQL